MTVLRYVGWVALVNLFIILGYYSLGMMFTSI